MGIPILVRRHLYIETAPCVTRQKFAWDKHFKSDLKPIYDRAERHTRQPSYLRPTYKDLRSKEDPTASWVTRKWNWQVPRPFLTVKSGRGACRFQWWVGPSYCEYPGETHDHLMSNIGGTYDLADQLPCNREFRHFFFFVVSQSQVPREYGVNLALDAIRISSGCFMLRYSGSNKACQTFPCAGLVV